MVAVCDAPFAKGRNEFDEEVGRSDCRLLPEGRACTGGHIALLYDQDETRGHRIATLSVNCQAVSEALSCILQGDGLLWSRVCSSSPPSANGSVSVARIPIFRCLCWCEHELRHGYRTVERRVVER